MRNVKICEQCLGMFLPISELHHVDELSRLVTDPMGPVYRGTFPSPTAQAHKLPTESRNLERFCLDKDNYIYSTCKV